MCMKKAFVGCALGLALFAMGCQNSNAPVAVDPPPSTDHLPEVENPRYAHWSQFPVGTKVVRYKEVTNKNGTVYVTTTYEVTEVSDERAVVSQQVSVKRPEGDTENPPQDLEFIAKFRLPETVKLEDYALPSPKAKLVGTETREFCGRTAEAERYEWVEMNEAGPMSVILCLSNRVPGQLLREDTLIERDGDTSLETVISIEIPEDKA